MYNIEEQVKKTIKKYNLLNKKDKVVVALSGGKDSVSVLYLLNKLGYNVQALMIDLDLGSWSKQHKKNMIKFCSELEVKLTIIDLKKEVGYGICYIKSILKKKKNLSGCTVCGIIKRLILNKYARKLKADKIATGHNLDDETQTVLMNFLKGNVLLGANSSPATGVYQKGFVQRIKPLFFIPENEIRKFSKEKKFPVLYDKCPCAIGTYRVETRSWLSCLSDKQKLKIVENFQKIIPSLKKAEKPKKCKNCEEPARNDICNACKIFLEIQN